jgi:apolipoprotein N-acyltransferase
MRQIPVGLWAMAVLSGILQILPFPIAGPTPLWRTAFCWIALLPLFWALLGNTRSNNPLTLPQGAALGYICGFIWYLGNCYWIYQTMYLYGALAKPIAAGILLLFCLYLGLYHALFGMLIAAFRRHFGRQTALLLVPFAWVAVELARARITGLPWDLLGTAQVDNPLLTRLAPVTGVYGLSFIIAAVNALWLIRIRIRERRFTRPALTIAGVAIIVVYIAGLRLIANPKDSPTTATATLVQENLEVGAANTGPQPSHPTVPRLLLLPQPLPVAALPPRDPGTRRYPVRLSHPQISHRISRSQSTNSNPDRPHRLARITRPFRRHRSAVPHSHVSLGEHRPCPRHRRQHRL